MRSFLVASVLVAGCGSSEPLPSASGDAGSLGRQDCATTSESWKTPIGDPRWQPFGAQRIVVPIGAKSDGYAAFYSSVANLVAPNHKFYAETTVNAWGPLAGHAGPYDTELDRLLAAQGKVDTDRITTGDFSAPKGIVMPVMLVPSCTAGAGRTNDGENLPMIDNALFPLKVSAPLYKEGVVFDPDFTVDYPSTKAFYPAGPFEGFGHTLLVFGESMEFAPAGATASGRYEWRIRIVDTTGAGWEIRRSFTVQ